MRARAVVRKHSSFVKQLDWSAAPLAVDAAGTRRYVLQVTIRSQPAPPISLCCERAAAMVAEVPRHTPSQVLDNLPRYAG